MLLTMVELNPLGSYTMGGCIQLNLTQEYVFFKLYPDIRAVLHDPHFHGNHLFGMLLART